MKMRLKQMIFWGTAFLILAAAACEQKCWKCYQYIGACTCINGNDSIRVGANSKQGLIDSQNVYHSRGYTCEADTYIWRGDDNLTCGRDEYNGATAAGDSCI
jgi:hypothetical protein